MKINIAETRMIRSAMEKRKSIKITINIDAKTLDKVRSVANQSGVPYQRLINRKLGDSLSSAETTDSRLERLEREIKQLKKKLAA